MREFLSARPLMPIATSTLGFVETVRTLDQIGDYPTLMLDLVREITEILITDEVRDAAAALPSGVGRSMPFTSRVRRSSAMLLTCS